MLIAGLPADERGGGKATVEAPIGIQEGNDALPQWQGCRIEGVIVETWVAGLTGLND